MSRLQDPSEAFFDFADYYAVRKAVLEMERKEMKTYTLTPEEVEKLLAAEFGGKVEPVNEAKLAKLRQQRAKYRASK